MPNPPIKVSCEECQIDIYRSHAAVRDSTTKRFFCTGEHRKQYTIKNRIPNVQCALCGKPFYKHASSMTNSKSGLYFCTREHQIEGFKTESGLNLIQGPKPALDPVTGERITRKREKAFCSSCDKQIIKWKNNIDGFCPSCSSTQRWLAGEESGTTQNNEMASYVRRYIRNLKGEQCWTCGWNEVNPVTGKIPVQIDHVDGDSGNNKLENLQLLCPNHHSLTPPFGNAGGRAGKSGRVNRYKKQ